MPLQSAHPLTVESVSQLVEEDILRRGLKVGERYFTAEEAGKRFGVSRNQPVDSGFRNGLHGC